MSELNKLLAEAFAGLEPIDPSPSRADVQRSLHAFKERDRILRWMLWFAVLFMTGVCVAGGALFYGAEAEDVRTQILGAVLFLFGMTAISWAKMVLFQSQQHFTVLRELKLIQLRLLDAEDEGPRGASG